VFYHPGQGIAPLAMRHRPLHNEEQGVGQRKGEIIVIAQRRHRFAVEQSMQEALYATGGTAQSGDEFHRTFGSVDSVRRVYEKQSAQDDRRYIYYYIYTLGVCHLSVLLYIIALHIPAMK